METAVISNIEDMLKRLPDDKLFEARDFIAFLLEKQKKHEAFAVETLQAEQEPTIKFDSIDDAIDAILNET
jgi:transcription elongation factor